MAQQSVDNPYGIQLTDGEKIEYAIKHHWMLLLSNAALPLLVIALTGGLALFRRMGGQLFARNVMPVGIFDVVNMVLLTALGLMAGWWFMSLRREPKRKSFRRWLLAAEALLLLLFAFRYLGGRVFSFNAFEVAQLDLFNRTLLGIILIMLLVCVYLWIDWADDSLVLTNRRIVHDHRVLFQRHVQDQIMLEKLQSIKARQSTYTTYWLDYGTLMLQATTAGRRITFHMANHPQEMQKRATARLKSMETKETADRFESMVETNVYGGKPLPAKPTIELRTYQAPKMLSWLFYDNPKIEDEKGTITWQPHWIFVFASVAVPLLLVGVSLLMLLVSIRLGLLVGGWAIMVGVLLLLANVAWGLWRYEDTRNDVFVLTPSSLIKVDKKPFGPENRITAGLASVQNVSFEASFMGRIIGYGVVRVQTAGGDSGIVFEHIPDPREATATISDYLARFKKGAQERALKDTLALLQVFHQTQVERGEFDDADPALPAEPNLLPPAAA